MWNQRQPLVQTCTCTCQRKSLLHVEHGQTTAEYALVLLAAATIAMLVVAWAGSGAIDALFDEVMEKITSLIK